MYRVFSSTVVFATMLLRLTHADTADLVGSWEFTDTDEDGTFVTRLTLEPDGGMQFTTLAELGEELLLRGGDDDDTGDGDAAFTGLARDLAQILAAGLGITGADYPPFEAGVIENLLAEVDAEAIEQIFVEAFEMPLVYSTAGDILTLIDTEGVATVWLKVGQSSAVAPATWARVKLLATQ